MFSRALGVIRSEVNKSRRRRERERDLISSNWSPSKELKFDKLKLYPTEKKSFFLHSQQNKGKHKVNMSSLRISRAELVGLTQAKVKPTNNGRKSIQIVEKSFPKTS
jgi:hypothetical protein